MGQPLKEMFDRLPELPVNEVLDQLGNALGNPSEDQPANAVLVAPPGAGKTTRAALYLAMQDWASSGKIIMLEPRRIAARSASAHMAGLLNEKIGQTIGLKVRFENRSSTETLIEVVTEGVFTRMILDDPELTGVSAIIFDEFHERSVDADLGLALALDAQSALRPDLRLLVMSATLDGASVATLMDNAPIIESKGRSYPVKYLYQPRPPQGRIEQDMAEAIINAASSQQGSILAFLPGQGEIHRTAQLLEGKLDSSIQLHKLYGAMEGREQDAAIKPARDGTRKIVLATSIAETSITIDGVNTVIDSGLSRVPRFDPTSGITRLETIKASRASIDQRAGRAGRTAPGTAIRLWHESNNIGLAAQERPQILEADMRPLVLDLIAWGASDPAQLKFMDLPGQAAWKIASDQLVELNAIKRSGETGLLSLTPLGEQIRDLPVAPHLAIMILNASKFGMGETAARLALLISEPGTGGREADLDLRLERLAKGRGSPRDKQLLSLAKSIASRIQKKQSAAHEMQTELSTGAILSFGMAERIARRQQIPSPTNQAQMIDYHLANGKRAVIDANEPLAKNPMLVIAEMQGKAARPRILSAAAMDEAEFMLLHGGNIIEERRISLDPASGQLQARAMRRFKKLVLSASPVAVSADDPVEEAIINAIEDHGLSLLKFSKSTEQLLSRLQFANENLNGEEDQGWPSFDPETLRSEARDWLLPFIPGVRKISDINDQTLQQALVARLPPDKARELGRLLPTHFTAPTGSRVAIRYQNDQAIVAIRVQELYGLDEHPVLGSVRLPIIFELLSPAQRPIQTTQDIHGFWRGSWADVRRDMKGRYPKHVWPEEPQFAEATRRAKPRK